MQQTLGVHPEVVFALGYAALLLVIANGLAMLAHRTRLPEWRQARAAKRSGRSTSRRQRRRLQQDGSASRLQIALSQAIVFVAGSVLLGVAVRHHRAAELIAITVGLCAVAFNGRRSLRRILRALSSGLARR